MRTCGHCPLVRLGWHTKRQEGISLVCFNATRVQSGESKKRNVCQSSACHTGAPVGILGEQKKCEGSHFTIHLMTCFFYTGSRKRQDSYFCSSSWFPGCLFSTPEESQPLKCIPTKHTSAASAHISVVVMDNLLEIFVCILALLPYIPVWVFTSRASPKSWSLKTLCSQMSCWV